MLCSSEAAWRPYGGISVQLHHKEWMDEFHQPTRSIKVGGFRHSDLHFGDDGSEQERDWTNKGRSGPSRVQRFESGGCGIQFRSKSCDLLPPIWAIAPCKYTAWRVLHSTFWRVSASCFLDLHILWDFDFVNTRQELSEPYLVNDVLSPITVT